MGLLDRTRLPEEPSGTSGRWEQDKDHRRTAKARGFSETESSVESDSERGSERIPMVSELFGDRRSMGE